MSFLFCIHNAWSRGVIELKCDTRYQVKFVGDFDVSFQFDSYVISLTHHLGLGVDRAVEVPATSDQENIVNNSTVIEILVHLLCREREANPTRREFLFRG